MTSTTPQPVLFTPSPTAPPLPADLVAPSAEDHANVKLILSRMPFASTIIAPHVRLVGQQPLPEINARGGRDVEGWTAIYEAVVQPDWVNGMGGLHGAAAAWLVDMVTGCSFHRVHTPTWKPRGPSISIDMTYYNPAPAFVLTDSDTKLRIETVIDRMGGQLSTARCLITDWNTGSRIASGMHTTMKRPSKPKAKL